MVESSELGHQVIGSRIDTFRDGLIIIYGLGIGINTLLTSSKLPRSKILFASLICHVFQVKEPARLGQEFLP